MTAAAVLMLAGCAPTAGSSNTTDQNTAMSEIGQAAPPSFRALGTGTWAMTYDASALPRSDIEVAVRERCAGSQWCKVMGWSDRRAAPTALPMTDRELAAQRFSYTLNRASGMDEFSWN